MWRDDNMHDAKLCFDWEMHGAQPSPDGELHGAHRCCDDDVGHVAILLTLRLHLRIYQQPVRQLK